MKLLCGPVFNRTHVPTANFDTRLKLALLLSFLLSISFSQSALVIAFHLILLFVYALIIKLPISAVFSPSFFLAISFALILSLAASFGFITTGHSLFTIFKFRHFTVDITEEGLSIALLLFLRISTSIASVYVLIVSSEWAKIIRGLSFLKIPHFIIQIMLMSVTYIYYFLNTAIEREIAQKSRTICRRPFLVELKLVANRLTGNWRNCVYLMTEVNYAMISRGALESSTMAKYEKISVRQLLLFFLLAGAIISVHFFGGLFV